MNVFEPRQLTSETTRASMVGAAMMVPGFDKFPLDGNIIKQLWEVRLHRYLSCGPHATHALLNCRSTFTNLTCLEVRVDSGVPAVVVPVKPKLWLLGELVVPPQTAIELH